MHWNIGEFYHLAKRRLPPNGDIKPIVFPLRSIPWKFALCRYHADEARRILAGTFTWPEEKQYMEAVGKVLHRSAGTEEGRRFTDACFRTEAHVIAFAQSLHSTADILAQVLYISLKLDGIKEKSRSLDTVVKRMKEYGVAPRVVEAANSFLNCEEFCYLRAYVNTTKHRSLVRSGYSIGLVPGQEKHGLRIAAFEYGSKSWPPKWMADFIGADFERLSNMFGETGIALTAALCS